MPVDGVHRISETYDRVGLMARDPLDLGALAEILLGRGVWSEEEEDEVISGEGLEALSIGVLDSEWGTDPIAKWKWGSSEVVRASLAQHGHSPQLTSAQKQQYASAADKMKHLCTRVVYPIANAPQDSMLQHEGEAMHSVSCQS